MSRPQTRPQESHLRSILKALTWRFIATVTTITITYVVSGDGSLAVKVGGIDIGAKLALYYGHERAWQLLPRGAIRRLFRFRKRF
jgi:uncharacterized membrane protein